tara:strand:+ start:1309 stop:1650 length:342 start_codon:yes stop_codon:yes gene_type:complete
MLNADLENFTIDQFAGALALSLGAVGSLLLVIWQSKCHCRINLCYLFTCERKPGPTEEDPKNKKDKKTVASGEAQSKAVAVGAEEEDIIPLPDSVPSTPKANSEADLVSPPNP